MSLLSLAHARRRTREVVVGDPARGGVIIGGAHPVVVQSMLTADTMDTEACVRQALELAAVGCQIVRITAPTVKDAANLRNIREELWRHECRVPIVADIHFKPEAALEAAQWVEAVRINPGNFIDRKKFAVREYSDAEYAAELDRLREAFSPLVRLCQERGRALRIGTNHGSLSDRIMNRYGDSPRGMVESAIEFAAIAREHGFHHFVFSMKSSNPKVMIAAYRLLCARLDELGPDWNYPIHSGVTEAGDGEDGRIKSAIGIGSLLQDGIGDTIRVSLTEDSPHEIPVCRALVHQIGELAHGTRALPVWEPSFDPFSYARRVSDEVEACGTRLGGEQVVRVVMLRAAAGAVAPRIPAGADVRPEAVFEDLPLDEVDPAADFADPLPGRIVTVADDCGLPPIAAFRLLAARLSERGARNPILLKDTLGNDEVAQASRLPALQEVSFDPDVIDKSRRNLPHWHQPDATYFVTFRLADSLPQSELARLAAEKGAWIAAHPQPWDDEVLAEYVRRFPERIQMWLDAGHGACVLQKRDAAAVVVQALRHFDGDRYTLGAWAVMPNHVHVIVTPRGEHSLPEILHSWKSYTGHALKHLAPEGLPLWQAESYDHLVRGGESLQRLERYVLSNPRRAHGNGYTSTNWEGEAGRRDACATSPLLASATVLGSLLCDGIGDAVLVRRESGPGASLQLAFNILQAAGCRSFKTDYVACPSCGRTLFDLQEVTARIKARTQHLKGVKIAVMGCIVNGPGEMADADFGYVGGAPGKINLYVGRTAVKFNIPQDEAVERLVDLIREHGRWLEPENAAVTMPESG
jgi:(E)-4-hydroxy-3-methylbut-2-enyl-diphosphate synthase